LPNAFLKPKLFPSQQDDLMEMLLDHNFKYPEFGAVTAFTVTQVKDEFTKLDFVKNRYDDHVLSFLRQVEEEKTV